MAWGMIYVFQKGVLARDHRGVLGVLEGLSTRRPSTHCSFHRALHLPRPFAFCLVTYFSKRAERIGTWVSVVSYQALCFI
jgi:hypothetical protein